MFLTICGAFRKVQEFSRKKELNVFLFLQLFKRSGDSSSSGFEAEAHEEKLFIRDFAPLEEGSKNCV